MTGAVQGCIIVYLSNLNRNKTLSSKASLPLGTYLLILTLRLCLPNGLQPVYLFDVVRRNITSVIGDRCTIASTHRLKYRPLLVPSHLSHPIPLHSIPSYYPIPFHSIPSHYPGRPAILPATGGARLQPGIDPAALLPAARPPPHGPASNEPSPRPGIE